MVGDDHVGSLRLQVLPAAHLEAEPQQILDVTDQEADNSEGEMIGQVYKRPSQFLQLLPSRSGGRWTEKCHQYDIIPVSLEF